MSIELCLASCAVCGRGRSLWILNWVALKVDGSRTASVFNHSSGGSKKEFFDINCGSYMVDILSFFQSFGSGFSFLTIRQRYCNAFRVLFMYVDSVSKRCDVAPAREGTARSCRCGDVAVDLCVSFIFFLETCRVYSQSHRHSTYIFGSA